MVSMRKFLAVVLGGSCLFAVVLAQEPAPAVDLAKENAALKQQLAVQAQPKLSPAEVLKQAQDAYTAIFKEAAEKAGPAVKRRGDG